MTLAFHLVFLLSLTGGLLISGTSSRIYHHHRIYRRASACPCGWTSHGARCYIAQTYPRTMADAEARCRALGGHLTSIHSSSENYFVKRLMYVKSHSKRPFWIGFSDAIQENSWMWTDGSAIDYLRWHSGQPNHDGDCAELSLSGSTLWYDRSCKVKRPFVCGKNQ